MFIFDSIYSILNYTIYLLLYYINEIFLLQYAYILQCLSKFCVKIVFYILSFFYCILKQFSNPLVSNNIMYLSADLVSSAPAGILQQSAFTIVSIFEDNILSTKTLKEKEITRILSDENFDTNLNLETVSTTYKDIEIYKSHIDLIDRLDGIRSISDVICKACKSLIPNFINFRRASINYQAGLFLSDSKSLEYIPQFIKNTRASLQGGQGRFATHPDDSLIHKLVFYLDVDLNITHDTFNVSSLIPIYWNLLRQIDVEPQHFTNNIYLPSKSYPALYIESNSISNRDFFIDGKYYTNYLNLAWYQKIQQSFNLVFSLLTGRFKLMVLPKIFPELYIHHMGVTAVDSLISTIEQSVSNAISTK